LVLAIPLLLGALGTAISAWFSDDGPIVPDPSATPPLRIVLQSQGIELPKMTDDELWLVIARDHVKSLSTTPHDFVG
jgi:hypothetical protein